MRLALVLFLTLFPSLLAGKRPEPADPPTAEEIDGNFLPEASHTYLYNLLPSQDAEVDNMLQSLKPIFLQMRRLLAYVNEVDEIVTKSTNDTASAPLTTCNHRESDWKNMAKNFFHHRRLGNPDLSCITDAYDTSLQNATNDQQRHSAQTVYNMVTDYSGRLDDLAPRIALGFNNPLWSSERQAARQHHLHYEDRSQICTHDFVGFAKLEGKWYLNNRITSRDPFLPLESGDRVFATELDGGDLDSFSTYQMNLVKLKSNRSTVNKKMWSNDSWAISTTALEFSAGAAFGSEFGKVFPADNVAVELALDRGNHNVELAFDATTPSNIAILALPLAMNVVPVALIADVNTFGMLVYTLLTDVLTAVPLAIKGVEVLLIGKKVKYAAVTRISGGNLWDNDRQQQGKAAEIWVAECVAEGNFITQGSILLVVALLFMVGGVVAEIVAKRWVQKRRRMGMSDSFAHSVLPPQAAALVMATENTRGKRE